MTALVDELRLVGLAVAVWAGAALGLTGIPAAGSWIGVGLVAAGGLLAGAALIRRRRAAPAGRSRWSIPAGPVAVALVGLVLGLAVGHRGATLYRQLEPGPFQSLEAVVRGDPEPVGVGWRVELQRTDDGARIEATAFGTAGFRVRRLSVGERVVVSGRIQPVGDRPWLVARHVVARASVNEISVVAGPGWWNGSVNRLREVIVAGGSTLDDRGKALYSGLVIGDDRFQPLSQRAQFRASGLTHLLAVSGQNVAFVLLVIRPLLLLVGSRLRLVVMAAVLVIFVAVTRAEPSVLRAAAVAAVATWAVLEGRSRGGLRALSLGVSLLILVDPFLVRVVGFQLSVAASVGILLTGRMIAARLPGPRLLTEPAAVTLSAQLGVSPLLLHHFGPMSLASLPANLAAGWAAGAVMTLGLTSGPLSALAGQARFPAVAAVLQWPAGSLVGWIDGVARWSTRLPFPLLDGRSLGMLLAAATVAAVRPRATAVGRLVAVVVALIAAVTLLDAVPRAPERPIEVGDGATFLPGAPNRPSVLILTDPSPAVVDRLVAGGITGIDLVVSEQGDTGSARVVVAVTEVVDVGLVLAPPHHRIKGARRQPEATVVTTGWGALAITPAHDGKRLTAVLTTP